MKPTRSVTVSQPGLVARARGWIGRPLVRGALALGGLVVLSLVGRFAVAGGQVPPAPTIALPTPSASVPVPVPVPETAPDAGSVQHAKRATPDDPVYLNEATADDLRRLPGIGAKRAAAVLELRRRLGRFKQIEDLLRVRGIGRATLRKLRPLVRLDQPDGGAP